MVRQGTASAGRSSLSGFAPRPVGTISAPQALTITNTGDAALRVTQAQVTGPAATDFMISADTCLGASVQPGATCTIDARFSPTASGQRNGTLEVTSNDLSGPLAVPLTGGVPWTLSPTSYPQNSTGVPVIVDAVTNNRLVGTRDFINIYAAGKLDARCETTTRQVSLSASSPKPFAVTADVGPAQTRPFRKRAIISRRIRVLVHFTPARCGGRTCT